MYVKDIMHTAVTTVTPETRVSTAYHVKVDLFLSKRHECLKQPTDKAYTWSMKRAG